MSKFCQECGEKSEESAKFCNKCGTPVKNDSSKTGVTTINHKKGRSTDRKITNKLLCKLIYFPWIGALIVILLSLYAENEMETFFIIVISITSLMTLIFGIWGLVRLARARHKVATMIVILALFVLIFKKIELVYNLSMIGLFVSTVMGLIELHKLPDSST